MVWVCWKRVIDVANTAEDIALDFFLVICILSASEQQQAVYNAHDLPRYEKRCMCRSCCNQLFHMAFDRTTGRSNVAWDTRR